MKIQKLAGATVMSLAVVGLVAGGSASALTGSITNTGPDSFNKIESDVSKKLRVENDNDLDVDNDNRQRAYTGDAEVRDNTTGGDATSGDASNSNATTVAATINNAGSASAWAGVLGGGGGSHSATIEETGPDSFNKIEYSERVRVSVENDNDIDVDNDNDQRASSGDAEVKHNTTGGNATSGNASNTNTTSVTVNVTN